MKKERKTKTRKSLRFTALLLILAVTLTLFPVSGTDTQPPGGGRFRGGPVPLGGKRQALCRGEQYLSGRGLRSPGAQAGRKRKLGGH